MSSAEKIVIGTRGSALARWQADHIAAELRRVHPGLIVEQQIVVTEGDRKQTGPVIELGGKGVWVKEIEEKLLAGDDRSRGAQPQGRARASCRAGLSLVGDPAARRSARRAGQPQRRDAARAAAGQPHRHLELAPRLPAARGAQRSQRRAPARQRRHAAAQGGRGRGRRRDPRLRRAGPPGLRGAHQRAAADHAMLPAIGQGALALEARAERRARAWRWCAPLSDPEAETTVAAERALLAALGVGCRTPVAGHATRRGGPADACAGLVGRPDASEIFSRRSAGAPEQAAELGAAAGGAADCEGRRPDPGRARRR